MGWVTAQNMHIPSTICLLEDSFSEHKARQGLSDIRAVAEMGDVALGSSSCLDSRNRFRCLLLKETGMGSTRGQDASSYHSRHTVPSGPNRFDTQRSQAWRWGVTRGGFKLRGDDLDIRDQDSYGIDTLGAPLPSTNITAGNGHAHLARPFCSYTLTYI